MIKIKYLVLIFAFVIAVWFALTTMTGSGDSMDSFNSMSIREKVVYLSNNETEYNAFIDSDALTVINNNGEETVYKINEGEFYVSIAPYISSTHPWQIHSVTGCRGELANKNFTLKVTNLSSGEITISEIDSHSNGFIDLWLEADYEYSVEINYSGLKSTQLISSYSGSNTCITTMQLQ